MNMLPGQLPGLCDIAHIYPLTGGRFCGMMLGMSMWAILIRLPLAAVLILGFLGVLGGIGYGLAGVALVCAIALGWRERYASR